MIVVDDWLPWWRILARHRCTHPRQRCIHGDEIIWRNYKRAVCLRCGKSLRELPLMCSMTGRPHMVAQLPPDEPPLPGRPMVELNEVDNSAVKPLDVPGVLRAAATGRREYAADMSNHSHAWITLVSEAAALEAAASLVEGGDPAELIWAMVPSWRWHEIEARLGISLKLR